MRLLIAIVAAMLLHYFKIGNPEDFSMLFFAAVCCLVMDFAEIKSRLKK